MTETEHGSKRERENEQSSTRPTQRFSAYNVVDGKRIKVDVKPSKVNPGKLFVDGLRDAIAKHYRELNYKRDLVGMTIFHRGPDGDEIKDGELPTGTTEFAFQLPGEENPVALVQRFVTKIASDSIPVPAKLPDEQRTRRVGRNDFQEEVQGTIEEIFKINFPIAGQSTTALVLPNASGTGKTFSTITFPTYAQKADPDRLYLLAYIGFNIHWPLNGFEEGYLKGAVRDGADTEQAVMLVVMQRLLHVLALLLASKGNLQPYADSDVFPLMPIDLTAVWYTKFPPASIAAGWYNKFPTAARIAALEGSIVSMAKELHEQQVSLSAHDGTAASAGAQGTGQKPTVILVNLDEAQKLDECVKHNEVVGLTGGARYALRCLRELQKRVYDATDGKCLLLPIATGINPRTALSSQNEGRNIELNCRLVSTDEFLEIGKRVLTGLTKQQLQLFALVCYPRIRTLREGTNIVPLYLPGDFPAELGLELLEHALSGTRMYLQSIPPPFASSAEGVPFLDMAVWDGLNRVFGNCAGSALGFQLPISAHLPAGIAQFTCYKFEMLAYHVIGYTLMLFWNPTLVKKNPRCQLAFCRNNPKFEKIFRLPTSFMCRQVAVCDPKLHLHPFDLNTSPEKAYQGPLSRPFTNEVRDLTPGEGIWMWCGGGNAPFDYILIIKDQRGRCHACYGDAMHRPDKLASDEEKWNILEERASMADRASKVHAALTEKLEAELSLVLDPAYEVFLVTNSEVNENTKTTTEGTTAAADTVHILCPNNFNFEPFTPILFRTCVE